MAETPNLEIRVDVNIKSEINYQGVITQDEDGRFWAVDRTFGPFKTFYDAAKYLQESVKLNLMIEQSQNIDGGDKAVFVTVEDDDDSFFDSWISGPDFTGAFYIHPPLGPFNSREDAKSRFLMAAQLGEKAVYSQPGEPTEEDRVDDYKSTAAQLIRDGQAWAMSKMWHGATISDYSEKLSEYADSLENN